MFQRIRDFFVDWRWLTPQERLGIQSRTEAELAQRTIERRKQQALENLQGLA